MVIREIPGITPQVLAFAEEVVDGRSHGRDAAPVRHARNEGRTPLDGPGREADLRQP